MATTIETTGKVIRISEGRNLQPSNYYPTGRTAYDITLRYPRAFPNNGGTQQVQGFHRATLYVIGQGQPSPIVLGSLIAATLSFSSYPSRERDNEVYAHCTIDVYREIELVDF